MPNHLQVLLVTDGEAAKNQAIHNLCKAAPSLTVTSCDEYQDVSKLLVDQEFACVLVIWTPPARAGANFMDRIRSSFPAIPVVVLTSSSSDQIDLLALQAGAQDCLQIEGLTAKVLRKSITYAIERQRITREIEETRARLQELASRDSLTQLLNRRGLEEALLSELEADYSEVSEVYALLLDLDDFSYINDRFGFVTGDIVLKEIASKLHQSMRTTDFLGRVGRDEFLIILPRTRLPEAMKVADRLRLQVGDIPIVLPSGKQQLTASVGIAAITKDTVSIADLLFKTGQALAHCKTGGKNQIALFNPEQHSDADVVPIPVLVEQLCRGIGLRSVRQEIYQMSDESVVGYELLSRGPIGPFEAPYDFFRLCTEQSVLNLVDLRCAQACVKLARELQLTGRVHVNLFPSTILDTPASRLAEVFPSTSDIDFCVEISEQQIIGEPGDLNEHIRRLRDAKVRIALDDVGFGRSSLESLVVLEPDVVKIDRKWVTGATADRDKRKALERMIKIAHALNAELVAEGIEDRDDYLLVRDLGVSLGQGWYWGKPH